jgi:hypothetical protein
MDTVVAFVDVHVSVDDWPLRIVVGDAANVAAGGAGFTVTVAVFVTVPPGPVAVSVYVVVEVGLTLVEPESACEPRPLSMETDVAFADVQVRVDDWPLMIVVGDAENVAVGGVAAETVTVTCAVGGDAFAVVKALSV